MAYGKPGRPRKEPVAVVVDDPGIEFKAKPAPELHPSDVSAGDREASREARTESREGFGRKQRKPLGVPTQRLQADVPSGMTGRWMNDVPGRIQRAIEGGYEFISSDGEVVQNRDGGRSEIVGTGRDGGAMKAYLMALPTVFYEEDQTAKMSQINKVEESITRGPIQQATDQEQGTYYKPGEGISIRPNTSAER